MQPSKSMVDYMMELNRLFPKSHENVHTPITNYQPTVSQPTPNYSSSSTDSFSPDIFPELSYNRNNFHRARESYIPIPDGPRTLSETPFAIARRPIVGRKILGNLDFKSGGQKPPSFEERFSSDQRERSFDSHRSPIKHWRDAQTPPNSRNVEPKNYMKNNYYELFPENRGFEFKTPVKTPSINSNMSPCSSISQNSPVNSNFGMFTPPQYTNPLSLGPNSPMNFGASSPMNLGASSPMNLGASSITGGQKMCTFCRKNGETPLVYMTHTVKEKRGNRNIVTCPILRSHVCVTCGASGDNAHTITYCPVLRSGNNGMPLYSTTVTLKNTPVKSNAPTARYFPAVTTECPSTLQPSLSRTHPSKATVGDATNKGQD